MPRVVFAQNITFDGRFSSAKLTAPNYVIDANQGRQFGGNLFHSFGKFNLSNAPVPESATFTSTGSNGPISNVIGRVTGGNPSSIDGRINGISGASLYLINPSGIVFGQNATVNVSGGFHASTADYLRLSDGAKFQATNPDASTFSSYPPEAFGFMTAAPANIAVNGSRLGVSAGQTLGLVARGVSTTGAALSVPAGTIHVTSVAPTSTGEVPVEPRNVSALTVTSFGPVDIKAGSTIDVSNNPGTLGSAGSVFIRSGALTIDASAVRADNSGPGAGGDVTVTAGNLTITPGASISSRTIGRGSGGNIAVNVSGLLSIDGTSSASPTGISAASVSPPPLIGPPSTGNAGNITVSAGTLRLINNGRISASTQGSAGSAGRVTVNVAGKLSIDGTGQSGVSTAIASESQFGTGKAGEVRVSAGSLAITNGGQISASTFGPAAGGDVTVMVTDDVEITRSAGVNLTGIIASAFPGSSGAAGQVGLTAGGAITLLGGGQIASSTAGAGSGRPAASGDAGTVMVSAPHITVMSGAEISSTTAGTGKGGSVIVTTPGALILDGTGVANTRIAASAIGSQSGAGGSVTVGADTLTIEGGAQIASSTAGPGKGGDIAVTVANGVTLSGSGPSVASGISAAALLGSSGAAGEVVLTAGGALALSRGAQVTSSTAGAGKGGTVQITALGPLTLIDPGTGIVASATSTASGNAGSVMASAPQISVSTGAEIASTTAGTGMGGSVSVTTPGALVLDGKGVGGTQIAASATGPQSGPAGSVTVKANALTVGGGAQIASFTAGLGKGGDIDVMVASDITLPDPGPQITAQSTGSGDAGSITVSAVRLLMNDGAKISTEAKTSTANGGNITLHGRDFLHLVSSEISTSVKGETGNGGNITIDPQLVILDHSLIKADAIAGHGGNITITAGQFIPSSDSTISATSQLGISGTIVINGPRVDVNGALVVLSSQLRGRTEVLREACAARSDRPISSLVEAGRGGLPQDPEATLPALYIAGRDLNPNPPIAPATTEARSTPVQTTVRLTMRCG